MSPTNTHHYDRNEPQVNDRWIILPWQDDAKWEAEIEILKGRNQTLNEGQAAARALHNLEDHPGSWRGSKKELRFVNDIPSAQLVLELMGHTPSYLEQVTGKISAKIRTEIILRQAPEAVIRLRLMVTQTEADFLETYLHIKGYQAIWEPLDQSEQANQARRQERFLQVSIED